MTYISVMNFKVNILALAETMIVDLRQNEDLKNQFWTNFSSFFKDLDVDSAKKLNLLVTVVSLLSFLYNRAPLYTLTIQKREHFIERLYQFPITKIIAGFTGLRSLMMVSYYSMEQTWSNINYKGPLKK